MFTGTHSRRDNLPVAGSAALLLNARMRSDTLSLGRLGVRFLFSMKTVI
jgi:hypothetical protein